MQVEWASGASKAHLKVAAVTCHFRAPGAAAILAFESVRSLMRVAPRWCPPAVMLRDLTADRILLGEKVCMLEYPNTSSGPQRASSLQGAALQAGRHGEPGLMVGAIVDAFLEGIVHEDLGAKAAPWTAKGAFSIFDEEEVFVVCVVGASSGCRPPGGPLGGRSAARLEDASRAWGVHGMPMLGGRPHSAQSLICRRLAGALAPRALPLDDAPCSTAELGGADVGCPDGSCRGMHGRQCGQDPAQESRSTVQL